MAHWLVPCRHWRGVLLKWIGTWSRHECLWIWKIVLSRRQPNLACFYLYRAVVPWIYLEPVCQPGMFCSLGSFPACGAAIAVADASGASAVPSPVVLMQSIDRVLTQLLLSPCEPFGAKPRSSRHSPHDQTAVVTCPCDPTHSATPALQLHLKWKNSSWVQVG